jgi:hypothetical protein
MYFVESYLYGFSFNIKSLYKYGSVKKVWGKFFIAYLLLQYWKFEALLSGAKQAWQTIGIRLLLGP